MSARLTFYFSMILKICLSGCWFSWCSDQQACPFDRKGFIVSQGNITSARAQLVGLLYSYTRAIGIDL